MNDQTEREARQYGQTADQHLDYATSGWNATDIQRVDNDYRVTFPTIVQAAAWVDVDDLAEFVIMSSIPLDFTSPVTVRFKHAMYQAMGDAFNGYDPTTGQVRSDVYIRAMIHRVVTARSQS